MMLFLERFELSLHPDYVSKWRFWEAARELLQNSIDNDVESMIFEIGKKDYDWTVNIGSNSVVLKRSSLLMGISSKRGDSSKIGQFGEGYKLALLVLLRLGYGIEIINGSEIWIPRFEYSDKYEEKILIIYIYDREISDGEPEDYNKLVFRITGVKEEDIDSLNKNYRPLFPINSVVTNGDGKGPNPVNGDIYVGGLFVCNVKSLEDSYNFSPNRLQLDRDRMQVSSFDLQWETSAINRSLDVTFSMLERDSCDLRYASSRMPTSTKNAVLQTYKKKYGEAIPVSSQEEIVNARGKKFQLVPATLKAILQSVATFIFPKKVRRPKEQLENFFNRIEGKLTEGERQHLLNLIEESRQWNYSTRTENNIVPF